MTDRENINEERFEVLQKADRVNGRLFKDNIQ